MNADSAPMMPASHCPQCGRPLDAGAPAGLCPACLLQQGAAADTLTGGLASFEPPPVAELAEKFPQLEILEFIGRGGMGAVYKARQRDLDRIVALKILPPGVGDAASFKDRFTREARALAKLNHPNIVTIYEFGQTGGLYFFLMEYVDGVTLRQLLEVGRISPREALAIVPQICDALQFAHDHRIVHRDIKPENILMDRRGRVKVADFGLAKIIEGEEGSSASAEKATSQPDLTNVSKVIGTPNYMSPEQLENPGDVDHRADIYALGVVFYQMLTGELPGKPATPPSQRPGVVQVDVRLDEVVLRALAQEPERRYQQVSLLKTQVETIASAPAPALPKHAAERHFSRTALIGAGWVLCFPLALLSWSFAEAPAPPSSGPLTIPESAGDLTHLALFLILLLGFATPPVVTVLGWVAVAQIRRSGGRIHGLWLAVADGLLFPLLALDLFIVTIAGLGLPLLQILPLRRVGAGAHGVAAVSGMPLWMGAAWWMGTLLLIGLLDAFIIWRVWQAVRRPASGDSPDQASATSISFWKSRPWRKGWNTAVLAVPLALVLKTWVVASYRISGEGLSPELPLGSRILVWKLGTGFVPQDIIAYEQGDLTYVGRVVKNSGDALTISRNEQSDEKIARTRVIGKVISVYWRGTAPAVAALPAETTAPKMRILKKFTKEDRTISSDVELDRDDKSGNSLQISGEGRVALRQKLEAAAAQGSARSSTVEELQKRLESRAKLVAQPRVIRLYELSEPKVEDCTLLYQAKLRTKDLQGRAYLEMWCRFPGFGEAFSRGLDQTLAGSNGWTSSRIPFFLKKGEMPDLVRLNVVIEGEGEVFIKDVELSSVPPYPRSSP